jgi:Leucine-rich repeat (LRR) protein
MTNLVSTSFGFNDITDISPLAGASNLVWLELASNNVSDTSVLAGKTQITSLDLSHNSITDISSLSGLPVLNWLNLADNPLTNIGPLTSDPSLIYVDLSNDYLDTNASSAALTVIQQLQDDGAFVIYIPQRALPGLILGSPARLGANQFRFTLNGPAGEVCEIQTSTNLPHWTLLTTVTNTNGALQFIDPSPAVPAKFYRVLEP